MEVSPNTSPSVERGPDAHRRGPHFPRPLALKVLAVAAAVVLVVAVVILRTEPTASAPNTGCGPCGVGTAVGNPMLGVCGSGGTPEGLGGATGVYVYALTVESSTLGDGSVAFRVLTSTGAVYTARAGRRGLPCSRRMARSRRSGVRRTVRCRWGRPSGRARWA